ncbi:DUF664 domain-containing protein [Aeromicrobium sp. CF4.19]|uniref:mycothiol transferase n=1 Tax=Aeromicrobium sp. CF4.19 TaxID=3373082 RepID=UPI003EE47524
MDGQWIDPAEDPREGVPQPRGERDVVTGYLRHYRLTLELKLSGLDAEQLARRSVPPSGLSLLGLLRHLAKVEHLWSVIVLQGRAEPRLYVTADEPGADFDGAVADEGVVQEAWTTWRREVAAAEAWLEQETSWDRLVEVHGEQTEVRDVLVHLVEEYARHIGHVDLLRECIDGRTGQ